MADYQQQMMWTENQDDIIRDMKLRNQHKQKKRGRCSDSAKFVLGGSLLLVMMAMVPIWNAAALLSDFNYLFWAGARTPQMIILVLACLVPFYALIAAMFFFRATQEALNEQNIMMIGTTFVTLFGLCLMIGSLFLTNQAEVTSTNLLYNCDYSPETHRLYEYSQVLQNIRATPKCALKFSVQECDGYQDAAPYTTFLQEMESSFKCAGFCYRAPAQEEQEEQNRRRRRRRKSALVEALSKVHVDHVMPLALVSKAAETRLDASSKYPPTLFSDSNWQASCENMAAREMKNFAGDIGIQTFYQGLYLVLISVATGFLKLLGLCYRTKE